MTRDDPAAFVPPPAFGPFRVLHQIGIGALGPVFRTYEPTRDRLVAVKVFRLDVTPEQAGSLADELSVAADAGLFHPSIVEPLGAGVEGTVAYRAEEYVAAESLDVAVRHYAPAALDKALPFITQLAGAIDFARTGGVGHGGLHLRDVFVTPDEARASGFGIVEALERTGLRAPVRRPYSAPERIAGASWSTPADVFSLAVIAYELLTGRRPSGTGEQIAALSGANVGPYADVVRSVLARAMDEEPARRYQTALGFASALDVAARSGAVTDGGIAPARARRITSAAPPPIAAAATAASSEPPDANPPPIISAREAAPTPIARPEPVIVPPETVDDAAGSASIEADEPPQEDISVERDDDAAHHALLRELEETDAPTLFDAGDEVDDERLADLAIEEPAVPAINRSWQLDERPAPHRLPEEPTVYRAGRGGISQPAIAAEDDALLHAERPRPAMLPAALGLIIGLLLGFGLGYAVAGRETNPSTTAAAPSTASQGSASGQPASNGGAASTQAQAPASVPPNSGRAWSEQAVTPPAATRSSGDVPPVPGDAPAGAAPSAAAAGPPEPRPTTGRLIVRSTPSGAGVTVNGRWRGRTPLTLDALPFGAYAVRVVQSGYAVAREDVSLSAGDPARTLSLAMERERSAAAPSSGARAASGRARSGRAADAEPRRPAVNPSRFAGTIYVDSNPRGARVLIDGRSMGTTPVSIPDIKIGSHVVRLELADHRVWTASTRVAAGQETRVTGSLERIR